MKSEEVHIIRFRPAKTHLESEKGARGENRLRLLSLRQNKDSRRVGGHAPPQRHLERSAATTKVGANGGENARASVLRSEGVCSPVKKPRTRRRKRGSRGENNRTSFLRSKVVVFPSFLFVVPSKTSSTCLPLRREAQFPILRPAAPARRLKRCRRIGGKGFCAVCIRTLTAKDLWCMN